MHANFFYGRHVHSTGNETIAWQHMQIEHGGHIALDFQVLTSIYCQKHIKVNIKSKKDNFTVCVTMISTPFMKTNNQTITAYRIYMIFWLIFWSHFVTFLGDSISINCPKCNPISIQWARCRSQLYWILADAYKFFFKYVLVRCLKVVEYYLAVALFSATLPRFYLDLLHDHHHDHLIATQKSY